MNADRFIESGTKLVYDFPTPVFLIVDASSARTTTLVKIRGRHQGPAQPPFPVAALTATQLQ
jgi:hypothetical protein